MQFFRRNSTLVYCSRKGGLSLSVTDLTVHLCAKKLSSKSKVGLVICLLNHCRYSSMIKVTIQAKELAL